MVHPSKREHIVRTAYEVFARQGFHATSMDTIISIAKVSRRTMYNHFPSKASLIVEALSYYKERYEIALQSVLHRKGNITPIEKLRTVLELFVAGPENKNIAHGCLAVHAMMEYLETEKSILKACLEFKDWQISILENYVKEANILDSKAVVHDLFIILEGLSVVSERPHFQTNSENLFDKILQANT